MDREIAARVGALLILACIACDDDASPIAACTSDEDCRAGVCVADADEPADLEPLPLACGDEPEGRALGEPCERAGDCARGICLLAGTCAQPCAGEDHCEARERCQPVWARTARASLQPLDACVALVDLGDGVGVEVDVREDVLSGAVESDSGTLQLPLDVVELPGATPTSWFVLDHTSDDTWPESTFCRPPLCPIVLRTREPAPRVLFDAAEIDERCTDAGVTDAFTGPLNPVSDDDHADPVVVMIPNGPRSVVTDDGYALEVSDEVAGDVRLVTITFDTGGDDGGAREIDVNAFWIGRERDETLFDAARAEVDALLAQASIAIGEVRHVEVDGGLPERGATFEASDTRAAGFRSLRTIYGVHAELPALLRLSAGAGNAAVNVFFVDDIERRPGQGDPFALAGGIPAPPGMHGTGSSGIVVALAELGGDAAALGRALAHELGHHLGLFHTSESDGCVNEPLPDTPECRIDRDTGDGLGSDPCVGAGADNLMFFTAPQPDALLSADQIRILRASPLLHPR